MRAVLTIFLSVLLTIPALSQGPQEDLQQVYSSAGKLLEDGSYKQALIDYTRLINSGFENDAVWVKRGLAHYYLKEFNEAAADFDEAFKRQVRTAELLGYRALTQNQLGNEQAAVSGFEQAFAAGFKHNKAAMITGDACFRRGDYTGAVKYYDLSASWNSDDPVLFNNRGKANQLLNKPEQAIADFSKAISLRENYEKARSNRAETYYALKKWDQARADLDWLAGAQGYQLSADEFAMLGQLQLQKEEFEPAVANLENALKRQSELPGLYKSLGIAYAGLENNSKAIQMLEVSLDKEGQDKDVLAVLASVHFSEKHYASSKKFSGDYRKLDPANVRVQAIYGLSAYYEEDMDEALSVLSGISARSDFPGVSETLARIQFSRKNYQAAIDALASVSTTEPELLRIAAFSRVELQQYPEALISLSAWKSADAKNIEPWIMSARVNMILGKYADAGNDLTSAYEIDGSSFEVNALYGEALLMNQEYSEAAKYLAKAVQLKSDPTVHAFLGMASFRLENYPEAFKNLKIAADAEKLSGQGLLDLSLSAFEIQDYEAVTTYAAKAVAAGQPEEKLVLVRGLSYHYTNEPENAEKDLAKLISSGSKDARVYAAIGDIRFAQKNYEEAVKFTSQAISLGSTNAAVRLTRGLSFSALAQWDKAAGDYTSILELNKDHDQARYARGTAYFNTEKYPEAAQDLLLVNNKSLDLPVNEMIALSYARTGEKRAGEFLEKSITLKTGIGEIFFHAGRLQADAGEWQKAEARLNNAESAKYADPLLYDTRGMVRYELKNYAESLADLMRSNTNKRLIGLDEYNLGKYAEAISALNAAGELDATGLVALGDSYYRLEQWESAMGIFNRLVESGNADAQIYRHRGMVHAGMKNWKEARADLSKSLELEPENKEAIAVLGDIHFRLGEYPQVISLYEKNKSVSSLMPAAGLSFYHTGNDASARTVLEEVSRGGSGNPATEAALGHIYFKASEFEAATRSLTRALEKQSTPEWKSWLGQSWFALENFKQAEPLLEEAIGEGINTAPVYFAAGTSAYENGNNEKAAEYLRTAIGKGYSASAASYTLGNALYKLEKFDLAVKAYDDAINKGLHDPVLWNNRGKAFSRMDNLKEAIKSYSEALALDENYVRALENRGQAHYLLANYPEAAEDLRAVINLDAEEDGSVRLMLADTYVQLDEYRKAIVFFGEAIRKGKESAEVYYKRGSCYAAIEDWDSALSDLNQAFNMGKKDNELFLERANVNIRMDNSRAAMADLNEAIARDENNADAYFNRGYLHELNENFNEAIADYKKATDLNPEDGIAFYSLANSLVSQGNVSGALSPIDKAIALDPQNGNFHKVKGNILYRVERNDQACESWRKAVDLGDVKAGFYIKQYCD